MQPQLIALDTGKRLGSRGWANLQALSEAMDLALTWHPGLEPSNLKGRTKQEVLIVCARKPVSSKETLGQAPRSVTSQIWGFGCRAGLEAI